MYDPIPDGTAKRTRFVQSTMLPPPQHLRHLVHCYWELKTTQTLADDFRLHAMPDACVNILFYLVDTEIAGITALRTQHVVLNLGQSFHYAGIELLPGVWRCGGVTRKTSRTASSAPPTPVSCPWSPPLGRWRSAILLACRRSCPA